MAGDYISQSQSKFILVLFMFQLTVSGLSGQVAVKHAVQDSRQDLFWFQQKMEARIVQAQKVEVAT
jgi:hypothetical protein